MRVTNSNYDIPAELSYNNWPQRGVPILPILKLRPLFDQIARKVSPEDEEGADMEKGKKRAGSPLPSTQKLKKQKNTPDGETSGKSDTSHFSLPFFPDSQGSRYGPGMMPVWRHTILIRYAASCDPALTDFIGMVNTLCDSFSEPTTFNIGSCCIADLEGKLVAYWGKGMRHTDSDWLCLPSFYEEACFRALRSSYELESVGKTHLQAHLNIVVCPDGLYDQDKLGLPFEIQLEIAVSICPPSQFHHFDPEVVKQSASFFFKSEPGFAKKRINDLKVHQTNLCYFLWGQTSDEDTWLPNIDIPYLYSILRPAPQFPSHLADAAAQPDGLLPTLLPFQRRSVAWLLVREGKEITPEGGIVPKLNSTCFSFWSEVEEGNQTFYYNRLTRTISDTKFEVEDALGGILAEEPGLGKTLETISLILLNPAPEDRTPDMIRWDPEARLNVKAVKTTLVVTPGSLAQQWVDEIQAHAPSLKVLVYEGWAKVAVPILGTPEEKERVRKLLKKEKQKKPALKPKKKPIKRSRKGKGKAIEDGEDSDKDSEIIESTDMVIDEEEGDLLDWCKYVQGFDVVVTTYAVLRSDFNVAKAACQRPRREDVSYSNVERPRSPLVMVEWMRVVMDEVQMVGGGKTADMVSLIPRLASFAVSGTPARSHVSDLIHVLKFLRIDDIVGSPRVWGELLQPHNAVHFKALFQEYAIRTMKADVKHELTIPQQTRYIVGIDLGPIERELYDQMLENMLNDLGLDAHGVAASAGWSVDATYLRSSLRKLRAICTHPQVGQLQRQGDKVIKSGALKTMEEVLEDLKDKNWRSSMDDFKAKVQGLCLLAQYQQQTQEGDRYLKALQTLTTAETEMNQLLEEIHAAIRQNHERGKALQILPDGDVDGSENDKGKKRDHSPLSTAEEEENIPKTLAGEEYRAKHNGLQQRLREASLVLHQIKFLQGDVYHVLGGTFTPSEEDAYQAAEEVRRDLLKSSAGEANRLMESLAIDTVRAGKESITMQSLLIDVPFLPGGCESLKLIGLRGEADRVIKTILNQQSTLLWEWRTHIVALLSQKLNSRDGEADGLEYQRNLESQGEAEVYLQAYAALLADRREALLHERTLLALHDVREKKLRHTVAAIKASAALDELAARKDPELEIPLHLIVKPEDEVTHLELSVKRKAILKKLVNKALRTIASGLHGAAASIRNDKDPEKLWAKDASNRLRRLIAEQEALHEKLDADLAAMRKVFNQRIVYFRQLQEISDSVLHVEWEGTIKTAIQNEIEKHKALDLKIRAGKARQRYLSNLVQNKGRMDDDDDDDTCTLCKCEFVRGFITQCAHIFCERCMQAWMAKKEGKTCPMCRVDINPTALQRFTVGSNSPPDNKIGKPESRIKVNGDEPPPQSQRQIVYNTIDPEIYEAIKQVEALGDFGSKIQTLVKHLLYLQVNDPGAKSIVFSAWADSLHIVQAALLHNGVRSLRIDQHSKGDSAAKMFRKDPDISVLLLHGERENAGLNLTCASRVFLLESVVHHGFELQAIARIDRLGQTRPTEVYCYYAENTVERNILDLAARQGMSLYTKDNAAGTLNVSNFELDDSQKVVEAPTKKKAQKGDFIFQVDDMLAIMFPHMYEDIEYLVPGETIPNGTAGTPGAVSIPTGGRVNGSQPRTRPRQENAVAGPSRLGL